MSRAQRQHDFLEQVVGKKLSVDSGPLLEKSLRSLICAAPLDDAWHREALYYKSCLDLSYIEKDFCAPEISSMARDLGLSPGERAPIIIGKHAFQSALPLLDQMQELRDYIESNFSLAKLLHRDFFDNPSSALTPYFLGQIIRLLGIQNLYYSQEEDYLSARRSLPEAYAQAKELSDLGCKRADPEVLLLSSGADAIGFFSNAYAVHLCLDDAENKECSLILLSALAVRSEQERVVLARRLAHEMIHAQQNFAASQMSQIPKDERTLWGEALTDALLFLRLSEMDFVEEGYASIVISLLEILEFLRLDAEAYLIWSNKQTLGSVLGDLSTRAGLTQAELSKRFMTRFRELARLRRSGELEDWRVAAHVIQRQRPTREPLCPQKGASVRQ